MKINFERLFDTDLKKYKTVLLFGNCTSVLERSRHYVTREYSNLTELSELQYIQQSQLDQPSLFQSEDLTATVVTGVTDKSFKKWKTSPSSGVMIFLSPTLRTSSAFVKTIQVDQNNLAIGCYDTPLLRGEFEAYLKTYTLLDEDKNHLFQAFKTNPEAYYNFLKVYQIIWDANLGESFKNIISDLEALPMGDLPNPFILSDKSSFALNFALSNEVKLSSSRAYCRSVQTLYALKAYNYMKDKLKPRLFFKDEPLYLAASRRLSSAKLKEVIEMLMKVETSIKRSNPKRYDFEMFHMEQI